MRDSSFNKLVLDNESFVFMDKRWILFLFYIGLFKSTALWGNNIILNSVQKMVNHYCISPSAIKQAAPRREICKKYRKFGTYFYNLSFQKISQEVEFN